VSALLIVACDQAPPEPDWDREVLHQLQLSGSDLSKPHPAEFFLYFPTKGSAELAGSRLRDEGFSVQIKPGRSEEDWLCFVTKEIVPDYETLSVIRSDFNSLAAELGGEYDGWGTPIVH
jgi:hypothetical protein